MQYPEVLDNQRILYIGQRKSNKNELSKQCVTVIVASIIGLQQKVSEANGKGSSFKPTALRI